MVNILLAIIYLAFVSLGLPDALLGSAWPKMHGDLGVPLSYAGVISFIISCGTIISSLLSDRATKRLGPGLVTVLSVATTALALFGFGTSSSFWVVCLWALPYGLGAGSVDAALNNYVALNFAPRHMSWLHCAWGVGASLGPYAMGFALTRNMGWNAGYLIIAGTQIVLTLVLLFSLPLWKKVSAGNISEASGSDCESSCEDPKSSSGITGALRLPGAWAALLTFFAYCGLEQSTGLWACSYLVGHWQMDAKTAAGYGALFYLGITAGRALSGFMTLKFNSDQLIRGSVALSFLGLLFLFMPFGVHWTLVGVALVGFGCSPVFPSLLHSTPIHFGAKNSQAMIGLQMAAAYLGSSLVPPLFGLIERHSGMTYLPIYLFGLLLLMGISYHFVLVKVRENG